MDEFALSCSFIPQRDQYILDQLEFYCARHNIQMFSLGIANRMVLNFNGPHDDIKKLKDYVAKRYKELKGDK